MAKTSYGSKIVIFEAPGFICEFLGPLLNWIQNLAQIKWLNYKFVG
jgi:hypothetical protein